jgi:hypothetical protein
MHDRDPLRAAGSVFVRRGEAPAFGGTCFAFRRANRLLTAGHCVDGLRPEAVDVEFLGGAERFTAVGLVHHPTAELALIRLAADVRPRGVEPFAAHGGIARGEDFAGIGWVAGRCELFGGRIRRVVVDREDGHRHAEMSVAARNGFSGGPLFAPGAPHAVVAVMTANRTTRLALAGAGLLGRLRPQSAPGPAAGRGIALLASDLAGWLDEHVPEDAHER